jgi:hypothetical protein
MICMGLSTQSAGYHIGLSRVIVDFNIIILDKLQLSPLSKVQVWLRENILQTLMIHI